MSTIFVTGATGVLGRATVPRLMGTGHTVRALSRSDGNDATIRALGAEPARADLFDPESLRAAMAGADAVMHLATRIPAEYRKREAWVPNDRIRAEGTRNLVDAALETGVSTFIYPSFALVYPDSGDTWIDAATTPASPGPILDSTIAAETEVARFAASDFAGSRRGVALRMGGLYGPGLPSTEAMLALARRGVAQFVRPGRAFTPALWIDDAASALAAALDRAPSGVYDVVDDEPLARGEMARALARVVGRTRLLLLPRWLAPPALGPAAAPFVNSQRISNRRFAEATGWRPAVKDWRDGMANLAAAHPAAPEMPAGGRAAIRLLRVLALFLLASGAWQLLLPGHFFARFPGFGMTWVSVDGPYNEHLLRDFGGANVALGLVGLTIAARPAVTTVRGFALAVLVAQAAHFAYHAAHLDLLPTATDRALQTLSLGVVVILPAVLALLAGGVGNTEPKVRERSAAAIRGVPDAAGRSADLVRRV